MPDTLTIAIRSVLAQSFTDFELLVVGDGCTDSTADVVSGFADPRLRWFDLPKTPAFGYANRNLVLAEARGDLVAMMSHDDIWFPDHLELIKPLFDCEGIDLAYSRPLWVSATGEILPSAFDLNDPEIRAAFLARERNSLPSTCVVARRSAINAQRGFDESLEMAGDLDLWARIIIAGAEQNYAYLPTPTILHFRATWRNDPEWTTPEMRMWRRLHSADGVLPKRLKVQAVGSPQQDVVWRELRADPRGWATAMRAAVVQILDQRVIEAERLLEEHSAMAVARAEARAIAEMDRTSADVTIAGLRQRLDAQERTPGFRALSCLRKIAQSLCPQGTARGEALARLVALVDRLTRKY